MHTLARTFILLLLSIPAIAAAAPAAPNKPLRGTDWQLTQLEGKPVAATNHGQIPHLLFSMEDQRVSGNGGCNRIMGSFEITDDQLRLPGMASTMMACASGMEQERRFMQALEKIQHFRISGSQLELLDASNTVLMRFGSEAPAKKTK